MSKIIDGNQPVTVDLNTLTQAFTQASRAAAPAVPAQTQAQIKSAFAEKLAEIGSAEGTDQSTLAGLTQLFDAFRQDSLQENRQEVGRALKQAADRHATNVIDLALENVIGDDNVLGKYKEIFKEQTIKQFNTNPAYRPALDAYMQNGSIDTKLLNKIAKEQVDEFNKDRIPAEKRQAPAGMRSNTSSETAAQAASNGGGSGGADLDPRDLRDRRERAHYEAALGTAQRAGLGRDSEKAKAFAYKKLEKFREGVRNAKDTMGAKYLTDN